MTYKHLVAIGDSLVAGIGDPYPGLEMISLAERFADTLRQHSPCLAFTNLARHGSTSQDVVDKQLTPALDLQPDLLIFGAGANDTVDLAWKVETTRANIDRVLKTFADRDITIITLNYVDAATVLGDDASRWVRRLRPRMEQVYSTIRDLSQQYQTIFVDFWELSYLFTKDDWSSDGVHPNALGHLKGAQHLVQAFSAHTGIVLSVPVMK
jgi:lysophospholipase L1-like esterase